MKNSIFRQSIHHAYFQTDGEYHFPNSLEGDLLKQALKELDALMLEYCPEEMTKDQLENYEKNQNTKSKSRKK